MRKYILQILRLNVYLLINYKPLKITIFPFKSIVFTFLIPIICLYSVSPRDNDPLVHGPNIFDHLCIRGCRRNGRDSVMYCVNKDITTKNKIRCKTKFAPSISSSATKFRVLVLMLVLKKLNYLIF